MQWQKRRLQGVKRCFMTRLAPHCPADPLFVVPKAVAQHNWSSLDSRGVFYIQTAGAAALPSCVACCSSGAAALPSCVACCSSGAAALPSCVACCSSGGLIGCIRCVLRAQGVRPHAVLRITRDVAADPPRSTPRRAVFPVRLSYNEGI